MFDNFKYQFMSNESLIHKLYLSQKLVWSVLNTNFHLLSVLHSKSQHDLRKQTPLIHPPAPNGDILKAVGSRPWLVKFPRMEFPWLLWATSHALWWTSWWNIPSQYLIKIPLVAACETYPFFCYWFFWEKSSSTTH